MARVETLLKADLGSCWGMGGSGDSGGGDSLEELVESGETGLMEPGDTLLLTKASCRFLTTLPTGDTVCEGEPLVGAKGVRSVGEAVMGVEGVDGRSRGVNQGAWGAAGA